MHVPVVRTDRSAFDRIRDAILNREDPKDENPTGPGVPTPG
ncbi:hypothetical protein [Haloplanus aerogenes]|uniref:Uncharacterized protein n=1 Tax=Haloplanus aerogenes TaxID=660522 RepID=A0A3M0CUW5_9EURY|nr:hypothetical protein [Haloplanus aerogenes]RMB13181.1 hypothetical protein ATH50_2513 [Haloplanus aerogenes]